MRCILKVPQFPLFHAWTGVFVNLSLVSRTRTPAFPLLPDGQDHNPAVRQHFLLQRWIAIV